MGPRIRFTGSFGQVSKRFDTALARPNLQVYKLQLFADVRVRGNQFLRHILDRLIQTQSGLHRDGEEVQDVGQVLEDRLLALADLAVEPGARHQGAGDRNEHHGENADAARRRPEQ